MSADHPGARAAIYLRISQDRTGEERGVTRQREDCEALAVRRGWEVLEVYIDNDTSATSGKRRIRWEAMMAEVEAGHVDVVVGWTIDRTLRSGRDRLRMLEVGKDKGITISLARGNDMDLSTPAGRLAADILGAVAQNEIEVKSDRQRRAMEQAAADGRWVGGRKPFGYERDGVTPLEREAQAVVDGYAQALAGVSLREIASMWNAAGHTTGQAPWKRLERGELSPWRADSVRRVLLNPRYAGLRPFKGRETPVKAQWPALVPEETYRAAVRLLNDPQRRTGGAGAAARQLLTGIAVCGVPGCGLTVHGGGAKHHKPIYRCSSEQLLAADKAKRAPGTHVNRRAEPVDIYVDRLVSYWLERPSARSVVTIDAGKAEVEHLRERARFLRRRLETMAAEFGEDQDMSPAELRAMRAPVSGELGEVERKLADAGRADAVTALLTSEDPVAAWAGMADDLGRRRSVVDMLMRVKLHAIGAGTRTFREETVEITWR